MKKLYCLLVLALSSGAAMAGDLPHEAAYDWGGVYIGGSVGYGRGDSENRWTNTDLLPGWEADGDIRFRSGLVGLHAGMLYQIDRVVLGLEADYNFVRFRGDDSQFAGVINGLEIDQYATARVRAGWAVDRSLFYATGGVAYGKITKTDVSLLHTESEAKVTGWVAGAGYERAFGNNWIARLEYQHVNLGDAETQLQTNLGGYTHRAQNINFDTIRLGVSYKF